MKKENDKNNYDLGLVLWSRSIEGNPLPVYRGEITDEEGTLPFSFDRKKNCWISEDMTRFDRVVSKIIPIDFHPNRWPKLNASNFVFSIGNVKTPTVFKSTKGLNYTGLAVCIEGIVNFQGDTPQHLSKIREIIMPVEFIGQKNPTLLLRSYTAESETNTDLPGWKMAARRYIRQILLKGKKPPTEWLQLAKDKKIKQLEWKHKTDLPATDLPYLMFLREFLPLEKQ